MSAHQNQEKKTTANNDGPHIIAGVDGSPSSLDALRWAVHQAGLSGGNVEAVIAWQVPVLAMSGYGYAPMTIAECAEIEEGARKTVEAAISDVAGPGGALVRPVVAEGQPAQVLMDASADADLLVLGHGSHSGFADTLLGSVSERCFHHAHCPVVIMRGDQATRRQAA